jgi:hypothetical protein
MPTKKKTKANLKEITAEMRTWQRKTTVCQEATEACLESMEPASEETESGLQHQEVPKKEEAVGTVKALKKWYGDWHLAVQCAYS